MSRRKRQEKASPQVSASESRASAHRAPVAKHDQTFEKIYRIVLRIPRGRVMTYGQIARLLDDRYSPRLVGWAMHATPQDDRNIPWHRVINSRGGISTGRVVIQEPELQRWMLEAEGIVFDERGHCDLGIYQWSPAQNRLSAKREAITDLGASRRAATTAGRKGSKKTGSVKKVAGTSNRAKK
jgi:methylated-DNA-protein-cysteine methyltransferase related protein